MQLCLRWEYTNCWQIVEGQNNISEILQRKVGTLEIDKLVIKFEK